MNYALVYLEVDGKLMVCRVGHPYASILQALSNLPRDAGPETIEHFRGERKRIAAEVVALGAYEIKEGQEFSDRSDK